MLKSEAEARPGIVSSAGATLAEGKRNREEGLERAAELIVNVSIL
jgi:hypothetical protein